MLTPSILEAVRKDLDVAVAEVGKKHNLAITIGNGKFTTQNCEMKLKIATIAQNGEVQSKEANDFKAMAHLYGLSPNDLRRTFVTDKAEYKIIGLRRSAPKRPILGERTDGKVFIFRIDQVKNALAKTVNA